MRYSALDPEFYIAAADEIPRGELPEHYERLRERLMALFADPLLPDYSRTESAVIRALARAPAGLSMARLVELIYGGREDGSGTGETLSVMISRMNSRTNGLVRIASSRRHGGNYQLTPEMKRAVDALEEAARAYADGLERARLLAAESRLTHGPARTGRKLGG